MVAQHMVRTHEGKTGRFGLIHCVPALDLIKCLEQNNEQILLLTCSPTSELPYNLSTMAFPLAFTRTFLNVKRLSTTIFLSKIGLIFFLYNRDLNYLDI